MINQKSLRPVADGVGIFISICAGCDKHTQCLQTHIPESIYARLQIAIRGYAENIATGIDITSCQYLHCDCKRALNDCAENIAATVYSHAGGGNGYHKIAGLAWRIHYQRPRGIDIPRTGRRYRIDDRCLLCGGVIGKPKRAKNRYRDSDCRQPPRIGSCEFCNSRVCALCVVRCALCVVRCALCVVRCALCVVRCAIVIFGST